MCLVVTCQGCSAECNTRSNIAPAWPVRTTLTPALATEPPAHAATPMDVPFAAKATDCSESTWPCSALARCTAQFVPPAPPRLPDKTFSRWRGVLAPR